MIHVDLLTKLQTLSPAQINVLIGAGLVVIIALAVAMIYFFLKQPEHIHSVEVESVKPQPKPKSLQPTLEVVSQAPGQEPKLEVEAKEPPQPVKRSELIDEIKAETQADWMQRLRTGLTKTRSALTTQMTGLFSSGRKIDDDLMEELHEILFRADVGVEVADEFVEHLNRTVKKMSSDVKWEDMKREMANKAEEILEGIQKPFNKPQSGPWVVLVVGVNGVGKTTTIGKLAARYMSEGKKVLLAAADTFRAAAIEQLQVWGERIDAEVIHHKAGSDPAAVAFDAVKAAKARDYDILLIDTAGRLHNKVELMDELNKINRVIGREISEAPHETWLVIDATTGQNALQQMRAFSEVVNLSGSVVTKLDGTAKGGVLLAAARQHQIPIRYVGVGEKAQDLHDFKAKDFVESLF